MSPNISSIAEPAQRVAERPAGEERFITPQTRDDSGGISASAEHRASLSERGAQRLCFVKRPFSLRLCYGF